jgi:hypothetical protein
VILDYISLQPADLHNTNLHTDKVTAETGQRGSKRAPRRSLAEIERTNSLPIDFQKDAELGWQH